MDFKKNCRICSIKSSLVCSKCKLASYCSIDHQKADWLNHKEICFPFKLIFISDRNRKHYVAKSDIRDGQIACVKRPLMIFPMITNSTDLKFPKSEDKSSNQSRAKICLGCCEELSLYNLNTCFQCKWPVCNVKCANEAYHSKLECTILAKNGIVFRNDPIIYTKNLVLRALLLKSIYPDKWQQLLELKFTNDNMEWINGHGKAICKYIIGDCKLKEFDLATIMRIWQTLEDNLSGDYRTECSVTLDVTFQNIAQGCIPNVINFYGSKRDDPEATAIEKFDRYYYALRDIKKEEIIMSGIHDLQFISGTVERRETLKTKFEYECKCQICKDPTELKSFLSAVKCVACNNETQTPIDRGLGFMLMVNPLELDSEWKCNNCNETLKGEEMIKFILKNKLEIEKVEMDTSYQFSLRVLSIENDRKEVYSNEVSKALGNELIASSLELIQRLKIEIDNKIPFLHPNHYLVMNAKFLRLSMIFGILNFNPLEPFILDEMYLLKKIWKINREGSIDCSEAYPRWIDLNKEVVRISLEILDVMQKVSPNTTYSFGRICYFITFSKLIILKDEAKKHRNFEIFLAELNAWKFYKHKVENVFTKAIDIENTDAYLRCLKKMDEMDPDRNVNHSAIFESILKD